MDTQNNGTSSECHDPVEKNTPTETSPSADLAPLATPEITPTLETFPTPSAPPIEDISPEQDSELPFFQYAAPYPLQATPPSYNSAPISPLNLNSFSYQNDSFENKFAPITPPRTPLTIFKENFVPAHNSAPNTLKRGSRNSFQSNPPFSPHHIMPQIHSPLHISAPCSPKTEFSYPFQGNSSNELQMPQIGFLSLFQQPSPTYPGTMTFQTEESTPYSNSRSNSIESSQMPLNRKSTPTLVPHLNFDPSRDAQMLYNVLKSPKVDENLLTNLLCHRTDTQRQEIANAYNKMRGNYPIRDIKTKTNGKIKNLLMALCIPLRQFYCHELHRAVMNFGTDADCLIEILCTLTNEEIIDIKMFYQGLYDTSLEEDVVRKISGSFQTFLLTLSNAKRDESENTDINDAEADAQELYNARGSNESVFIKILCQKNFDQLKLVCQEYQSLVGCSLQKSVKKEFNGNIKEGFLAILDCVNNKQGFFAKQLHKSMAGLGTNNSQLIRLVVTRCEVDMVEIKQAFQRMYGKSLKSFIKGDTSGNYKHALYELTNVNQQEVPLPPPINLSNQNQMINNSRSPSPGFSHLVQQPHANETYTHFGFSPQPMSPVQQTSPQKVERKPDYIGFPVVTIAHNIDGATLLPAPNFNPFKDAKIIRKALKEFETNEDILVNVLCHRTDSQRQKIVKVIKQYYGKDLAREINANCTGIFNFLMLTLLTPITVLYCEDLHLAIKNTETNADCLIEVLCSLSNDEINEIKMCYQSMYDSTLEHDLVNATSGHFKRVLVSLCTANRDESGRTDFYEARADAQDLFNAGILKLGTDKSTVNRVLCQRNFNQLKLVFQEYKNMTGRSLKTEIKEGFSGDLKQGLLAIVDCVNDKSEFFAKRICKSIAGSRRNDSQFVRLIITHCEVDMMEIKESFYHKYGKTLKSYIKSYALGHYLYALYALIGEDQEDS